MNIDPITISLVALAISIISLLLSSYKARIDRRLQWEQMRGSIHTRFTSRGVEVLTLIDELQSSNDEEAKILIKKLIRVLDGIVDTRKSLEGLISPPLFAPSLFMTKLSEIKSDIDDSDPVFEDLKIKLREKNYTKANLIADGLLGRILGKMKKV